MVVSCRHLLLFRSYDVNYIIVVIHLALSFERLFYFLERGKMMKKSLSALAIIALLGLCCVHPASASKSLTKSYKMSVTMPEHVGVDQINKLTKGKVLAEIQPLMNLEYSVIVRNNEKILLRTIVAVT